MKRVKMLINEAGFLYIFSTKATLNKKPLNSRSKIVGKISGTRIEIDNRQNTFAHIGFFKHEHSAKTNILDSDKIYNFRENNEKS